MKKELFLMMLSIILLSSFQTKYYSGFIVNIKNYNCNIPFLISKDCSNNFDTLNVNNGFLDEKILITYPTYIKVKYGSFSKMIYLAPDNSLKLSFDLKQIEETFKFEGIGANENYLLDTLYKIGKIDYSRIYNKSLSITRSRYIDSSFNSLKDYFNNLAKVKSVNAEFIEYTNKLLDYEAAGYKIDNSYNDLLCNKLLNEVNLENEKYLSIPSFRNYIVVLLNCSANNLIAKSNGSESFYAFVDAELKITESINQPRIKEFLVFNSVYYLLFNMGVKNFDKYYTYFNLHNTDTTYRKIQF